VRAYDAFGRYGEGHLRFSYANSRENIGRMSNRGFEAEVHFAQRLSERTTLRVGGNITFAQDEIEYFAEAEGVLPYQRNTGRPWQTGLFYVADGIFQTQEDVDSSPHWPGAWPGDIRFVDVNGDGVIDAADRVRVDENGTPGIIGSFNVGATVGRLDLFVLFQGAGKVHQYVQSGAVGEFGNFFKVDADRRWTPENPNAEGPRAWNRVEPYWASNANTFFLQDAKYLRLKSASIGYSLPEGWLQAVGGMASMQVYLTGRNLLTWTPLEVMDPEIRNQAAHEYPPTRSLAIGLQVGF
jgi:TonB-dependent starch-binding outer membrane protein SusC